MAEAKVVKFCTQLGHVKSQHKNERSLSKEVWSRSRDPLRLFSRKS